MIAAFALTLLLAATGDYKGPPTPTHYVTDTADALSDDTRASVESELSQYEKATGHQVIVWIGKTTGDVPLESWTADAVNHWKVGRKGYDDGAVLFIFMDDHKVRIEVGYGLESSLTDADSHRIIEDDIRPRMRSGDVDGAVSSAVAAMLKTITPTYAGVTPPPAQASERVSSIAGTIIFIIVIFFIVTTVIFTIVLPIVGAIRYGYLVMREGSTAAKKDMSGWWWGGGGFVGGSSSSFGDSGGFSGGFSSGGGGFGGGGASGGW